MFAKRVVCQTHRLYSQNLADNGTKANLRKLFRNVAQPVAVVTSFMPTKTNIFHGATLSSFTSIAMDPYPLVSFALRIPSRMATMLSSLPASSSAHMVVNLLSAEQASTAVIFSRPDLHPAPFESSEVRYQLTEEGLPVLQGVVGAMSCRLVGKAIPLYDLDYLGAGINSGFGRPSVPTTVALQRGDVASELFIVRVIRVESVDEHTLPLIYHQRGYSTCSK